MSGDGADRDRADRDRADNADWVDQPRCGVDNGSGAADGVDRSDPVLKLLIKGLVQAGGSSGKLWGSEPINLCWEVGTADGYRFWVSVPDACCHCREEPERYFWLQALRCSDLWLGDLWLGSDWWLSSIWLVADSNVLHLLHGGLDHQSDMLSLRSLLLLAVATTALLNLLEVGRVAEVINRVLSISVQRWDRYVDMNLKFASTTVLSLKIDWHTEVQENDIWTDRLESQHGLASATAVQLVAREKEGVVPVLTRTEKKTKVADMGAALGVLILQGQSGNDSAVSPIGVDPGLHKLEWSKHLIDGCDVPSRHVELGVRPG